MSMVRDHREPVRRQALLRPRVRSIDPTATFRRCSVVTASCTSLVKAAWARLQGRAGSAASHRRPESHQARTRAATICCGASSTRPRCSAVCTTPASRRSIEAGTADAGSGPQPYFAMEFIRGAAADRLRQRARSRHAAAAGADGAECATRCSTRTSAGIIHRDLKPGNILVDEIRPAQGARLRRRAR